MRLIDVNAFIDKLNQKIEERSTFINKNNDEFLTALYAVKQMLIFFPDIDASDLVSKSEVMNTPISKIEFLKSPFEREDK